MEPLPAFEGRAETQTAGLTTAERPILSVAKSPERLLFEKVVATEEITSQDEIITSLAQARPDLLPGLLNLMVEEGDFDIREIAAYHASRLSAINKAAQLRILGKLLLDDDPTVVSNTTTYIMMEADPAFFSTRRSSEAAPEAQRVFKRLFRRMTRLGVE